jgi:23S rRNA pseudouridine1911/1915/1917 synthase
VVIVAEKPGRVDKLLADACPQYSRAALAKLFDLGLVTLDGKTMRAGHKIREGAKFEADISLLDQNQQVVELPVIYEDDNVLVVDKPAGIISHARGRYWYEPSVASFVRWKVSGGEKLEGVVVPNGKYTPDSLVTKSYELTPNSDGIERMGIVHRLDRATSGVMICAKNEETTAYLQKQFAARSVKKTYIAVLDGVLKDSKATIDAPIERNPKSPSTFRVGANGKQASTRYEVIKHTKHRSLVEFSPLTGRTHQIRIHAAFVNCPIVGDPVYGHAKEGQRLYLHAYKLEINIPMHGNKEFVSDYPVEFDNELN